MKRTGEIVLGIIGSLFYVLMAGTGAMMMWMEDNKDFLEQSYNEAVKQDPSLAADEGFSLDAVMNMVGTGGTTLLITAIIAIVLGIVAMFLLKGNKKPKVAGIIFIAVSVIISFASFGVGIFAGIFFLVAGIMSLVRKPKQTAI